MVLEKDKKLEGIRSFICLELNRETIDELADIQKIIKNKNLFYGKFTEQENFHLTLKFLGELSEEKLKEVEKKLSEIHFQEFEVSIGELGSFVDRYGSILWVKLNGKGVWDLQTKIDEALEPLGFKKESRFMSHITLARMKKIIDKNIFLEYIKNLRHRPLKFVVKEFCLKKSELFREGPIYTNLEKYALG